MILFRWSTLVLAASMPALGATNQLPVVTLPLSQEQIAPVPSLPAPQAHLTPLPPARQLPQIPQRTVAAHLPLTVYVGASELDLSGREEPALAIGLDFSGRLNAKTQVAVGLVYGPADIISALALSAMHRPTARAVLTRPSWTLVGGDLQTAPHALAGPVVRIDGAQLRVQRRLFGDIAAGRPKHFGGGDGGHVVQGRAGVATRFGTFAVLGSDISREQGRSVITVRTVQPESGDEATELDDLRRVVAREDRVRGIGMEADLKFNAHSVLLRAGAIDLLSHTGQRSHGAAGEARYVFTHPRLNASAYARHAPPSLPGTYIPGDSFSAQLRVPVGAGISAVTQGYSNTSWLVGLPRAVRSDGASAGFKQGDSRRGFSVEGNYRELRSAALPQVTRSVSARLAMPLGGVALETRAEFGENQRGPVARPLQAYSVRFTTTGEGPALWVMGSLTDHGFQPARARLDIGGDIALGRVQLEGGAGYGRGQLLGDLVTAWGSVDVPLPRRTSLWMGLDYVRWDYAASPYLVLLLEEGLESPWRITVGIRRTFAVPRVLAGPLSRRDP